MSRMKEWIEWQRELDSRDDPDMEVQGDWEFGDEGNPPDLKETEYRLSRNSLDRATTAKPAFLQ